MFSALAPPLAALSNHLLPAPYLCAVSLARKVSDDRSLVADDFGLLCDDCRQVDLGEDERVAYEGDVDEGQGRGMR